MRIEFPVEENGGNLMLSPMFSSDACLTFYSDGRIKHEGNGLPIYHHEITEEMIGFLAESEQVFVRNFLDGDYSQGTTVDIED